MENNTFKGSLFGGFKRSDVTAYIAKSSAESQERIAALEADVEKYSTSEQELREQVETLTAEKEDLSRELTMLRGLYMQAQASLEEKNPVEAEVEALRSEIAELRPQVEEYNAMKTHIASIELEAHHRSETLERSVREQLAALVDTCRTQCFSTLSALNETCSDVSARMHSIDEAVNALPASFEALRGGLDQLDELKK